MDLPPVAVLMEKAISAFDILLGNRVVIERTDEDNAGRASQIISLTTRVFGGAEGAAKWLCAPSMAFSGLRPLDLITTRHGAQMVVIHLTELTTCRNP